MNRYKEKVNFIRKIILRDWLAEAAYFPIWWYSRGLKKILLFCWREVKSGQEKIGLKVWVVNLFTPMFGQTDLWGRVISFFMRLIQVVFKTILMAGWFVILAMLVAGWILLPVIVAYHLYAILF